jgi:hypothetical protein
MRPRYTPCAGVHPRDADSQEAQLTLTIKKIRIAEVSAPAPGYPSSPAQPCGGGAGNRSILMC